MRMKAKMEGVNKTPTLLYKGQKIRGLQQITEMLKATANVQQRCPSFL